MTLNEKGATMHRPEERHQPKPHQHSESEGHPGPSDMHIRTLALCAVEAVEGHRAVEQLGKWVTAPVLEALKKQRTLRTNRNTAYRAQRRLTALPGRIIASQSTDVSLDCAVVMHAAHRSFAVTLRFEHIRQRWRATELSVL